MSPVTPRSYCLLLREEPSVAGIATPTKAAGQSEKDVAWALNRYDGPSWFIALALTFGG